MAYEGGKTGQARGLRKRMTAAERCLWARLRNYRFQGLRWDRQEPFGPYIVDFYCSTARVVVELDGAAHSLRSRSDAERQKWLEAQGVRVLRFSNSLVLNDLERVLEQILEAVKGSLASDDPEP